MAPAGLGGILGLSELSDLPGRAAKVLQGVETPEKRSNVWKWALPLILLAAILAFMLKKCERAPLPCRPP